MKLKTFKEWYNEPDIARNGCIASNNKFALEKTWQACQEQYDKLLSEIQVEYEGKIEGIKKLLTTMQNCVNCKNANKPDDDNDIVLHYCAKNSHYICYPETICDKWELRK